MPVTATAKRTKESDACSLGCSRLHFVGIGGVAMSGLARILCQAGYRVSGSDIHMSVATEELKRLGIRVAYSHATPNLSGDAELVVTTPAVPQDNPELLAAKRRGLRILRYAQLIGLLMVSQKGVAVSGCHGKTTTSAMIAFILSRAGMSPSWVIGGDVPDLGASSRIGRGDYMVVEACEYARSFLSLRPFVGVMNNIDEDHLDYYRDIDEITTAFGEFAELVMPEGLVVLGGNDDRLRRAAACASARVESVAIEADADWVVHDVRRSAGRSFFRLLGPGGFAAAFSLRVPGPHNVANAAVAVAVSRFLGADKEAAASALAEFRGARRRFQVVCECCGVTIVDDYGHHPREIEATLRAAREVFGERRLWCVFQPHQHSRTRLLLNRFSTCFREADRLVIAPIYSARDTAEDVRTVRSETLASAVRAGGQSASAAESLEATVDLIAAEAAPGDVVLTIGAGDVWRVAQMLADRTKSAKSEGFTGWNR